MSGAELDRIVHQPLRLKIMAALAALPEGEMIPFARLKKITQASDGNLSHQLKVLSEAGYVTIAKDFHKNRPRTRIALTAKGAVAFDAHVAYLKSLIGDL